MAVSATVLFGRPQHEVASLIQSKLQHCTGAWIVTGFATVEGIEAMAPTLVSIASKLNAFVLGSGTYRGFEALDRLVSKGVPLDRLFVHFGHTHPTGSGAKYSFYPYHPMLHSKIYYLEMPNGEAVAFVGSHNATGFALLGLNGEAAVMLTGPTTDPEMQTIRQHIHESMIQSAAYSPSMKEAFVWWTSQFLEGLKVKVEDKPRDFEYKRTIVILAVESTGAIPQKNDVIYFEIPAALRQIRALDAEVHIYVFASLPQSPVSALSALSTATASLWCTATGLEIEQGGEQLDADWYIPNRNNPTLLRTVRPFQPAPTPEMQQIRVKVHNHIFSKYDYHFEVDRKKWEPVYDDEQKIAVEPRYSDLLRSLNLIPPEDKEWFLVKDLRPDDESDSKFNAAVREASPESGSYILVSWRRKELDTKPKRWKK